MEKKVYIVLAYPRTGKHEQKRICGVFTTAMAAYKRYKFKCSYKHFSYVIKRDNVYSEYMELGGRDATVVITRETMNNHIYI